MSVGAAGRPGPVPLAALPPLSLRCRCLWAGPGQPAPPPALLAALPAEAALARRLGAGCLEFPLDVCALDPGYAAPHLWEQAAALLAAADMGATVHLPSLWTDLAALDGEVWQGAVRSVETALRAVAPLRPRLAVVHPAGYGTQAVLQEASAAQRPALLERLRARVGAALVRLRQAEGGAALAVENLEAAPPDLVLPLAEEAGVGFCLDVGHVLSCGGDPLQALESAGGRLAGLHLHDAVPPRPGEPVGRAHLALGTGTLSLDRLVAALLDRGCRVPLVLEVDGEAAVADSAARWRAAVAR